MQELHISVRNLVEFIFRAGDIDNRAGKLASAGTLASYTRPDLPRKKLVTAFAIEGANIAPMLMAM